MATVKQTLQANMRHKLPCNGYFFQLLAASAPLNLDFRVVNSSQPDLHKSAPVGFWYKSQQLLNYVEVESAIAQEITYLYVLGQTGIDRSVLLTELTQGSVIDNKAPVTVNTGAAGLVIAANTSRKQLILTADTANTGTVYLGGASVTAANATVYLEAGDSYQDTTAAIAAYYATASVNGQILRISEA